MLTLHLLPPLPAHTQVNLRYAGGCSKGELTLLGQEQAMDFGRWLRRRYSGTPLLPLSPSPHPEAPPQHGGGGGGAAALVSARTTNYSRTIASLRGVLTGLFPGAVQQQRPIIVHTSDEIDEFLCE